MLQGEEDLQQYINQLNQLQQNLQLYINQLNEYKQKIENLETKINEIGQRYKIGNFTMIERDNNLYIYLEDQVVFKLNKDGLNVKQVNQWNVGTPDLT